eukprot:TRINITY_DN23902_c0_g2_i1.p1 TRINITY_DN23902_c0_g2~~TRINITY_DN23902_c0_g2_i1.p1  ORF type:complete len:453 (+),score=110.31 TRINITY_DN23902_c0_g2_i1:95-1453(+)
MPHGPPPGLGGLSPVARPAAQTTPGQSPVSSGLGPPAGIAGLSPYTGSDMSGGRPPPGVMGLMAAAEEEKAYDVHGESHLEVRGGSGAQRYTVTDKGLCQGPRQYAFEDLKMGREIGKGSQANVRQCKHRQTGEVFAIKVVTFGPDLNTHGLQQELSQILELSHHPNLVRSYDAYFREGHMFILMEYMHHGSLAGILDRGGPERKGRPHLHVPEPELSHMMAQVLAGLGSLHARGILHRDLKPSNILANASGAIKICDFGVSRLVTSQVMAQTAVGARAYLSPERVRGEVYTKPADIWAVGLCCAELALGDFPWRHYAVFQLCEMISSDKAQVEWGSHSASPELRSFVARCMDQQPRSRASCAELMVHRFIAEHRDARVDLAAYLDRVHERPSAWRARQDPKGRLFYHNPETGQKQWTKPPDFAEGSLRGSAIGGGGSASTTRVAEADDDLI